ncbi:carboxylesterase/lipase family protein [Amycolatopsis sp. NPDC001319]|uniref:carboxylesterase/lipase family protein n=1 Tax=unclassified Amycolatopsis TaxID=2618356 RepID=UPI003692902E
MTIVRTASGKVLGHRSAHGVTFAGIPYAPTPVGAGRFAAPGPPPRWDGVRGAAKATAPQRMRPFGRADLSPVLGTTTAPGEYLSLTVSTPDPGTRNLPVLVFLHGGGFATGTGHAPVYATDAFPRDGIVLVTVNYRLGAIGWLDLPGAPANRGLLDVLAALGWINANIAHFGGDPGNVTLGGQSAGAMLVLALMTTPTDLFRRGISQSGHALCCHPPERAALTTRAFGAALGAPATAAALADLGDERILDLTEQLKPEHGFLDPSLGSSPFKPVLDGELLTRQPADGLRGDIGLLAGTNAEEANLYSIPFAFDTTEADLLRGARRRFPDPEARIARCRETHPHDDPEQLLTRLMTDAFREANQNLGTWTYDFRWRSPAFGGRLGACHCVELPFVFDCVDLPGLRGEHALLGPGEPPADLARSTHDAWVSFVTRGNPGWTGPHRIG